MGYYTTHVAILLQLILQTTFIVNESYDYDHNISSDVQITMNSNAYGAQVDEVTAEPNQHSEVETPATNSGALSINTSGCQVRHVDEFAEESLLYLKTLPPFECQNSDDVAAGLVYRDGNILYINETVRASVIAYYNPNNENDCYCCVDYLKMNSNEDSNEYRIPEVCTPFNEKMDILDEYMSITCTVLSGEVTVYRNYEFAVLLKNDVEARCRAQEELEQAQGISCPDRLSVLLMGIDSVSRPNGRRFMQRTHLQLREMKAIEFSGYNRVASNTFPNIAMALLMGVDQSEMNALCMPPDNQEGRMDQCLTLFDHFGAAGYRTAMVENMNSYGLFSYFNEGVQHQPADYYGSTFYNGMMDQNSGSELDCYRSGTRVSNDEAVFQWATEFQEVFRSQPHFGHFWISTFTHGDDGINQLQYVDNFLPKLLKQMSQAGNAVLNTTLLVLMSDHGYRIGEFSNTNLGTLEQNMPFLFLVFPPWFRDKYKDPIQQVRENAEKRLTTHYDMHATLRDIVNCRFSGKGGELKRSEVNKSQNIRGISLFDPVPETRTCEDAGIPEEFCSCSTGN